MSPAVAEGRRIAASRPGGPSPSRSATRPRPGLPSRPRQCSSFAGVGFYFDLAGIAEDETVLDLGSGSGTDSFVAALHAGTGGHVIGADMTEAQLAKARALAR